MQNVQQEVLPVHERRQLRVHLRLHSVLSRGGGYLQGPNTQGVNTASHEFNWNFKFTGQDAHKLDATETWESKNWD